MHAAIKVMAAVLGIAAGGVLSAFGAVPTLSSPANGAELATLNGTTTKVGSQKWFFCGLSLATRMTVMNAQAGWNGYSANDKRYWTLRATMGNTYTDRPQATTFSWSGTGPFTLTIKRRDGSTFLEKTGIEGTSLAVDNFEIAASYTWTVSNADGASTPRSFTTEDTVPRLLNGGRTDFDYVVAGYDDASGPTAVTTRAPHGVRDMGGYIGKDGRRGRQGLIVRNSAFESDYGDDKHATKYVNATNRAFWNEFLGIKTEIDLRENVTETKLTGSTLGDGVEYVCVPTIPSIKNYMKDQESSFKAGVKSVFKIFADSSKYPISFHCTHGKDRTGVIGFLLGCVLDYNLDDIYADYEATIFWNPKQTVGIAGANGLVGYLNDYWTGSTVQEKAVNFIKGCGINDTQLNAIREIMLEPLEDPDDPSVATVAPAVVAPDGVTVQTHTSAQSAFMALDQATRRTKFCDATYRSALAAGSRPLPTELSWTGDGSCTVVVKDAANATVFTTNLIGNAVLVDNLQIGETYTWSVTNGKGSANGSFETDATAPRLLRDPATQIDATADGDIFNVRDFGGRTGLDGKRVKTGLLYRSSAFDASCQYAGGLTPPATYVTDANRPFYTETLGIKTDVDLRNACEYGSNNVAKTTGPLGAGVEWVHFHGDRNIDAGEDECPQYGDFHKDWGKAQVKKFLDVFLDPAKYPVDFHCTSGQDRTGCFAFLLGGLLGVDENALYLDWELLALHNATAGLKSGAPKIDAFVEGFAPYAGATLQEKIEAYVKGVGVSDDQITAFRNLMLEGGYQPIPAHTHVWSAWTTNPAPTCVTAGTRTHTCTAEGCTTPAATESEVVAALGHDWVTVPGTPATTTSTGLTDGIRCSRCLEWQVTQKVIPMLQPEPSARTVTAGEVKDGKMTLSFGAGSSDLLLFAVWGATDVGDAFHLNAGDENGWDGFAFVARIPAATTSYEYTLPSGWGTTVKYVRFFMTAVDEAPVASLASVSGTDGAAVLDTGYVPMPTVTIAAYVKTPTGTRNQKIFEVGTEGANDPYLVCGMYVNADGKPAFNCRNSSKTSGWGCDDVVNSAVLESAEAMRWQLACGTPQGRYDGTKDAGTNPDDIPTAPANGTVKFYGVGEITQATVAESAYVHYLKPAMVYNAAGELVAGFYDSITHKAFASATETPFTAGDAASYARDLLNGVTHYGDSGTIEYVEPTPTHEHVWSAWTTNPAPTCVTAGTRTHTCTAEGCTTPAATESEEVSALDHDLGAWYTNVVPQVGVAGEMRRDCQRPGCDYYKTEVIPALDPVDPVDPTTPDLESKGWGYVLTGLGNDGKDVALVFTNTAPAEAMTLNLPSGVNKIWYLVVGGGGSGGSSYADYNHAGGGGGAGGMLEAKDVVLEGRAISVSVGAGGVAVSGVGNSSNSQRPAGNNGINSVLTFDDRNVTAHGGGGGGGYGGKAGKNGGSGGGSCNGGSAGVCYSDEGNEGGKAASNCGGGGGGGAGGAGESTTSKKGGAGGAGATSRIGGGRIALVKVAGQAEDEDYYCAGGGGGVAGTSSTTAGAGGVGGGGSANGYSTGATTSKSGANYGCGGGGTQGSGSKTHTSGAGYQGVVIVRYTASDAPTPVGHTHVWVEASRIEPTCEAAGSVTSNCTGTGTCELGGTQVYPLDPLGHDFGAWYTTVEPQVGVEGEERRDCRRAGCDHYETGKLDPLPTPTPEPTARTVTAGAATGGKMTLSFGAGTSDLLLFAVWGATDVGDAFHLNAGDENGWDGFAFVARIPAATTSYEYTLPSGWGTTVKYVRFFLTAVDEAPVASLASVSGTDGAAVLDTGYVPTPMVTIAAYVKTPTGTRNQKIFEVGTEGANDPYLVCDMYVDANGKPAFNCRNSSKTSGWGCDDVVNSAVLESAEAMRWQLACGTPQGRYDSTKDNGANPGDVPTAPANGTVKFYGVGEITQATVVESTYVHYLKPAMVYNASGELVAGFYDSITHKAFASATETPFTAGDAASYARDLLNGVTYYGDSGTIEYSAEPQPEEHDYDTLYKTLQTDGVGYILTDYVPANLKTVKVEIKARKLNTLVGFYYMANANTAALAKRSSPNGNELGLGFWASAPFADGMAPGLQYYCEPGTVIFKRGFCDTVWAHTFVTEGATVTVDGEACTTGKTPKNESAGGPIALFCCSMNGSTAHHVASLRVQYVRVWEGDTLVRDWVPATKNGVATLYDKVHDKCETVLGGGAFTADDELDPDYADKPANSWTREPSMSASYAAGTAPTFDIGEARYGSPVATYTAAQLAMLDGGVYTQVVKVAETDEYRELAKTVVFTVTGLLPREASVAPAIVWPNGETVLTHTALQRAYLAKSDAERRNVYADAIYRQTLANGKSGPLPTALKWTGDGISTVTVTRVTGTEKQFLQREIVSVKNAQNVLEIENLEIGTAYRWTVENALGTATGTFTTDAEAPRLLRDPGPEQIRGIRDLGGRTGLDGKRVRQGLVFRSSQLGRDTDELNFINDVNRSFWADFLGIRTELDFRGGTENPGVTKSPISDGVKYYKWPEPTASYGFNSYDSYRKSFALFLDRNNYPIDFHCAAGQDRTGVFAFLLNALLGVSEDELQKDWEVTAFWNSSVGFCFANYDEFRANLAAAGGANAREQAENYVINKLKFTMNDINTFRDIMLEEVAPTPSKPTVDGKEVELDKVFDTATSTKPIVYPAGSTVTLSGEVGAQKIAYGGKSVDVPSYYTATLSEQTVTLALNDNAKPVFRNEAGEEEKSGIVVAADGTVSLHIANVEPKLWYTLVASASLDTPVADWTTVAGPTKGACDFTDTTKGDARFYRVVVTDGE